MSLKYIICTVDKGYDLPLKCLLESMIVNGIDKNNILISMQQSTAIHPIIKEFKFNIGNSILSFYGVEYYKKIYEYSFFNTCKYLIDSAIVSTADSFFLLHDTCIILHSHQTLINQILSNYNTYDIIFADNIGRHNIGIYNYKAILAGYNVWKSQYEISKQFAIDIEHNQYGTENFNIKTYNNLNKYFYPTGLNDTGSAYIYNFKHLRTISSLNFFGIEKYFYYLHHGYHPNTA